MTELYAPVSNFKMIEEGLHPATPVWVIDLGTVRSDKFQTSSRKLMIGWELADEDREYDDVPSKAVITATYTLSFNAKANLRKVVETWRGKAFQSDEEAAKFGLSTLLGMPCMVHVKHETSSSGKVYANVAAVVSLPKGTLVPPPVNKQVFYVQPQPIPEELPEWVATRIMAAPEHVAAAPAYDVATV